MAIIVLGMHRSGTSVVTKLLELMGVYVGAVSDLLPPSPDNPKGFFERKDVIAVNQAIFRHHQSNWYQIEHFDAEYGALPENIIGEMQRIVKYLSQQAVWAIKDPRLCFTLPYWAAHMETPTIIAVSRNPNEIAQSLLLRNDMPIAQGMRLWQAYIEHALANARPYRRLGCDYGAIIDEPAAVASRLYDELKAIYPSIHEPSLAEVKNFVSPSLRRAAHKNDLTPAQAALLAQWHF